LVSERGQEGGHEAVPRDLAHRGQHAFVEGRLAQLLARKVDLDSDDLDHVPPQDCEMRFAHRLHGMPYTHVGPGSLDPVRGTYLTQETECSPQLAPLTAGHICMRGDFAPPPVVGDVDERPDECARGVASANGGTKSGSRCQGEWRLSVR